MAELRLPSAFGKHLAPVEADQVPGPLATLLICGHIVSASSPKCSCGGFGIESDKRLSVSFFDAGDETIPNIDEKEFPSGSSAEKFRGMMDELEGSFAERNNCAFNNFNHTCKCLKTNGEKMKLFMENLENNTPDNETVRKRAAELRERVDSHVKSEISFFASCYKKWQNDSFTKGVEFSKFRDAVNRFLVLYAAVENDKDSISTLDGMVSTLFEIQRGKECEECRGYFDLCLETVKDDNLRLGSDPERILDRVGRIARSPLKSTTDYKIARADREFIVVEIYSDHKLCKCGIVHGRKHLNEEVVGIKRNVTFVEKTGDRNLVSVGICERFKSPRADFCLRLTFATSGLPKKDYPSCEMIFRTPAFETLILGERIIRVPIKPAGESPNKRQKIQ